MIPKPPYHSHEEFQNRTRKLEELKTLGIDPYPHTFKPSINAEKLAKEFDSKDVGHSENAMKGKKVIMRNIPKSEYYKKIVTCYLVHAGISYDKEELSWLKSDMLVAETHCGCSTCKEEYAKTRECDACSCTISPTKQNCSLESFLQAYIKYCGNHIKQLDDQVACLKAACQMQAGELAIELFPDTFENILKVDTSTPIYWD